MQPAAYINYFDLTDKIFFTMAVVILFTCIIYKFALKLGKPMVVGGIISGLIISHIPLPVRYFDIESCTVIGNFGIVLFIMFVGTEFNFKRLLIDKTNMVIPAILILIPFALGVITYPILFRFGLIDGYASSHRWLVAIFIGIAVSMSTFSILIMFVNNTRLKYTKIGKLAVFCATFAEGAFWVLFAIILAYFQKNSQIRVAPVFYLIGYVSFVIFIMPCLIKKLVSHISTSLVMLCFIVGGCLLSAVVADLVNLHPIFGGFIFGALLPRENHIIKKLREHLLEFIVVILLPVYFVKTGIEASTNLSFDGITLVISLIFIAVSFLGKYGGALIVGKIWNLSHKEIMVLGSLLSIRGTMEIAILNVGHEVGLLGSKSYSALVIMSLFTTWVATSISLAIGKKNNGV